MISRLQVEDLEKVNSIVQEQGERSISASEDEFRYGQEKPKAFKLMTNR